MEKTEHSKTTKENPTKNWERLTRKHTVIFSPSTQPKNTIPR